MSNIWDIIIISAEDLAPIQNRAEALEKFAKPETIKDLRSFLGTFYFSRHKDLKLNGVYRHRGVSKRQKGHWQQLSPLAFPNPKGKYHLYTDASDVGREGS